MMGAHMLLQIAVGPECCVAKLAKMLELRLVHEHYVVVECFLGVESQLTDDAHLGPSIVQVELCVEQVSVTSKAPVNGCLVFICVRLIGSDGGGLFPLTDCENSASSHR